jgi:hypothetical protein
MYTLFVSSLPGLRTLDPLINFLAKSENSKHFSGFFKKNPKIRGGGGGGGKISKIFVGIWGAKSVNSNHFSFFSFFSNKNKNCGHYVCLASTKIMVTMFAWHLQN